MGEVESGKKKEENQYREFGLSRIRSRNLRGDKEKENSGERLLQST